MGQQFREIALPHQIGRNGLQIELLARNLQNVCRSEEPRPVLLDRPGNAHTSGVDQLFGFGSLEKFPRTQRGVLMPERHAAVQRVRTGLGDHVHVADAGELCGVVHGNHSDLLGVHDVVELIHCIVVGMAVLPFLHLARGLAGPLRAPDTAGLRNHGLCGDEQAGIERGFRTHPGRIEVLGGI